MTFQVIQLTCECIAIAGLLVTVFYMRRTASYTRITRKLNTGEMLTAREARLLDNARKR